MINFTSLILLFFYASNVCLASNIKIGITSAPLNLNPFYATDANSQNINRLTQLSLIEFDQNMKIVCIACEKFEEEVGKEKGHIIKFKLKEDLFFYDGENIKSQDVLNSWSFFTSKEIKSNHSRAFKNIENIEILSDYEFIIRFKVFSIDNLSNLALLKLLKKKEKTYLGAGDYFVHETSPLEVILHPSRENKKPKLIFKVVKDETTLALKILNKELDLSIGEISPRKRKWLKKNTKSYNFISIPGTNFKYLSFNHRNIHLKSRGVREALANIVPREEIIKYKLHNTSSLSKGLFSKSFEKYFSESQVFNYNPQKAKKILKSLGYKLKNKYWRNQEGVLKLDLKVSNNKSAIEIANLIKNRFVDNGILMKVTVQEWGTFMKNIKSGRFDMMMGQWIGFTNPGMLKFIWHGKSIPPQGANRGYYNNKGFDSLLDKADLTLEEGERNKLYKEAQNIAEKDYAYISLWHPNISWIVRDCIKGALLYPNGGFLGLRDLKSECIHE